MYYVVTVRPTRPCAPGFGTPTRGRSQCRVTSPPLDEYRRRLESLEARRARRLHHDLQLSRLRLLAFGVGAALGVAAVRGALSVWWVVLPIAGFIILVRVHERVLSDALDLLRRILFYGRGIARLEDRWAGGGEAGDRFHDAHHLYAPDLDLFGRGSLFELLSVARTRAGEETLAHWLKHPAALPEIHARQEAVSELARLLDLRESLAAAGVDARAGVHTESLVSWAEGEAVLSRRWLRVAAAGLTLLALAAALYGALTGDYAPLVAVVAIEILFSIPQRARVRRALHAAEGPARDLDVLAHVLACIEAHGFTAARTTALRQALATGGVPAATAIRRLHRLVELHDWQHNQFFAPFAALLLWGTHLAWAIEAWRRQYGVHVGLWLRTVGEFEALSSLAAFRYEHPADAWPEIVDAGVARFEVQAIAHPLLPASRIVRNDVRLDAVTRLLVVSGSNMSGKSTLLRTVGVNAVLAQAGAPVRATELRMSPLAVGATLRIQDSLQEGRSRFYAEISRIRELADLARGSVPLLFLLDELFQGTNSHDRLIGAAGLLRNLVGQGAIGLVTTHDLALTAIANDLAPRAANVHFEDDFEGGEMRFDYRLKPGPVTRSNALALMRTIGLDIESGQS